MSVHRLQQPTQIQDGCLWRSQLRAFGPRKCRALRANSTDQQQIRSQAASFVDPLQPVFASLAQLLCHEDIQAHLGTTQLGRGLVAAADLPPGSTVLTVDSFATLCVSDEPLRTGNAFGAAAVSDWQAVWGMELPPGLANYLTSSRGDWFRRLVAWLLWLKRHGTASPALQLYVQLLPQEADMCSLMNYTPEERAELQLPHLIALAEQERTGIQGLHDSLFSSSTGDLKALDLAPDFSDTLWAACMVNSRCFSEAAGRELLSLMVPLADMANHSPEPNAGFKLDPGSQTFRLFTTKAVQAGEELLISYLGEQPRKDNTQLMKDYGFVLPGNLQDTVTFQQAGSKQQLTPLQLMEAAAAAAEAHANTGGSPEAAAAHTRRVQAALKSLQPFVAQPSGSEQVNAAEGLVQQQELVQQLQQECQQQLDSLPTSIQEDQQLLGGSSGRQMPVRTGAAIRARLEHKQLLAATCSVLACYAKALDGSS